MRKGLFAAVLLLAPLAASWALGNPEAGEYEPVRGLENWDHRLDIEGRKAGKYNLVVRGTDQAGNVHYGGPYNIFVDPESDLPVVHISHPTAGARVGSLLHVVGTCIDDDGVKTVQVQLDDGEPLQAEGAEFWSLALNMDGVPDGQHTITVRSVDVNGTAGNPKAVRFHLDKKAPSTQITSHPSGSIVSGAVELAGSVEDANGVASLAVSLDGGGRYEAVKVALDKPGRQGTFRVNLDTRDSPDGPIVAWFKATDQTGSVAQQAFLLFINNEAPILEVLSPQDGAPVNGRVLVCGRASDKVGLKSLSYQLDGDGRGTIELTPGNPYWAHELDLSGTKAGTLQVNYILENLTGNTRNLKLRLKVDPEGDRPLITVAAPQSGARISGPVLVSGFVQDDDRVDQVEYILDGGAPIKVPAGPAFSFALGELAPGTHKLLLKAVDVNGVSGAVVELPFVQAGRPPSISVDNLVVAAGTVPFKTGMILTAEKDVRLSGTVRFSGLKVQAEYTLQGSEKKSLTLKKALTAEERIFDLLLPKTLPAGRIDFSIRASDDFANLTELRSFVFKGGEQGEAGILLVDSRLSAEGHLRLDERPLIGYLTGGAIQQAELDPPTELLRIDTEGPLFRVYPSAPGVTEPTRVRVSAADGSQHSSGAIRFISDLTPPTINVTRPAIGQWLQNELALEGIASDSSGLASLEYSLDGEVFTGLESAADGQETRFALTVPTAGLNDGPHLLLLRAVDQAGNTAEAHIPFLKDVSAPTLTLIAPRPVDEVNGLVTLVGRVEDNGQVVLVEASEDGTTFREVGTGPLFRFDMNLSLLPEGTNTLLLRCTDAAGNSSLVQPELSLNLAADRPVARIQLPAEGELIRNEFILSGMVFDDDGISAIYYRIDDGESQRLPGGNNFSVPLSLEQISDNEHTVEVMAEDLGGLMSETAVSRFRVSRSDPVSELEYPPIDVHLREVAELKGKSQDPNGIAEVRISFDNGLSFYRADGTETWRYRLDTRLLADGTHAVLVEAQDSTGAAGLYTTTINIDNRPPELTLDSPGDGQVCSDRLLLNGRCVDNVGLATLTLSIAPISASGGESAKSLETSLPLNGILAREIDLSDLAPGWYNVGIEASDQGGNRSYVSRNILIGAGEKIERVELFFPADGERLAGFFGVSGRVVSQTTTAGANALVLVDGQPLSTVTLNSEGYFHLEMGPETLQPGDHTLQVEAALTGEIRIASEPHRIRYLRTGPWVRITSFAAGDYVTDRPFLEGEAGYLEEEAASPLTERPTSAKKARAGQKVRLVEVSMDNGKSFRKADGKQSWRYRLETQELANGPLRLLVKVTYDSGETAVTRTQLTVDTRAPEVVLLEPAEGRRFNDAIELMGTANDESGLREIAVSLREGDKSRYQVPAFIQGLYLDVHTMGATYWDLGLGLTFFEDNVKLQMQVGMSPPGRFSGLVLGAKLLANIATLPFGYLFGPSWDFFSMSLAIGANFSYFTMSADSFTFTADGLVLGSVVVQIELARIEIARWRTFNAYSLYSEYQLWFISSDIEGGTVSRIAFGLRLGLL